MMLMLASVKGCCERRTLQRQQRPCFARPHAKARSYRHNGPFTIAHTHVVDILDAGGGSDDRYHRPHCNLLVTKARKHSYQTRVTTTSKVKALQRSALLSSALLTCKPRAFAVITQLSFRRTQQQNTPNDTSPLQLFSISPRGPSSRPTRQPVSVVRPRTKKNDDSR